jgi:putative addiction module component (TIGR02574 family)
MKSTVEEVVQKALALGEDERAEVASRLLDSLEQADAAAEAAWVAELERRAADLESGAVEGVSWEELQARLMRDHRGP